MKEIIIDVTDCCIMKCCYCGTSAQSFGRNHIKTAILEYILKLTSQNHCYKVFLGGGTFFCHPDWKNILDLNKIQPSNIYIDCPLNEEILLKIKEKPPDLYKYKTSISLWGINNIHDNLAGVSSFHLMDDYLAFLANHSSHIQISFVLTKELINNSFDIIKYIRELTVQYDNISFYFHRLMPAGRASGKILPSKIELVNFKCKVDSLSAENNLNINFHHTLLHNRCLVGRKRIFINHDGKVYGCGWINESSKVAWELLPGMEFTLDAIFGCVKTTSQTCILNEG